VSRRFFDDFKSGAIVVSLFAFILYLKTLAPTVIWGDSAKLATFVYEFDLSIRQGHHPLHTILGLLFSYLPFGDYAYRQNLMSAFFGALAVALVYLILLRWTHSVIAAIGGALSLAVSHVFWLLSVINESYTLFAFLMVLMIWLATVWDEKKSYKLLYCFCFWNEHFKQLPDALSFAWLCLFLSQCKRPPQARQMAMVYAFTCLSHGSVSNSHFGCQIAYFRRS